MKEPSLDYFCHFNIRRVALFELLWNPEEATSMLPTIEWENRGKASKMILTFRDAEVEVSDKQKSVNLGRADDNDVVIKGNLISRIHAKVEMSRGKFLLVDQSAVKSKRSHRVQTH